MTTEINPTPAVSTPTPKASKRMRALVMLAALIVVAAIGATLYYLRVSRWHEGTEDAYVQGHVVSARRRPPAP